MRGVIYDTTRNYMGRIGEYHVFYDTCLRTWGLVKDVPDEDIRAPHCGYNQLKSILSLKGLSTDKADEMEREASKFYPKD